jgi:hypothetical protein
MHWQWVKSQADPTLPQGPSENENGFHLEEGSEVLLILTLDKFDIT